MQFKAFLRYLVLSFMVVVVLLQALFLALPIIVETLIQKHLPRELPQGLVLSEVGFKIEKIGMRHILVTNINLGQGLSADLVDLQYCLKDLKRFTLEKVTVSGLKIKGQVDAHWQFHFNGAVFPSQITDTQKKSKDPSHYNLNSFSGFLPKQVVLKDANLSITTLDHEILIPFEVLASLDTQQNRAVLNASFHPLGQTIKTVVSGDFYSGIDFLRLETRSFQTEVLNVLLSGLLPETGKISFSGPVDMDILKKKDTDWQLSLSQLKLDMPNYPDYLGKNFKSGVKIQNFNASVGTKSDKLFAAGGFDLVSSLVPVMGVNFDLKLDRNKTSSPFFDLTVKNREINEISLVRGSNGINFKKPHFAFTLKGNPDRQTGKISFDCKNFNANHGKETLFIKNILLNSGIKGDFSDRGNGLNFDIQSDLSMLKFLSKTGQAEFSAANLTGKATITKQFHPLVHLDARIKNGRIDSSEFKMAAMGINARLPLVFPFENKNKSGSFSINEIVYDKKLKAGLSGNITQTISLGVLIGGQAAIPGLKGFKLRFEGKAGGGTPHARIDFFSKPFLLKPVYLEKIMPGLIPELSMSPDSAVKFSSKGSVEYSPDGVKTRASIMIDEGDFFFPDMNLALSNIAARIDFNDLILPESLPGQVLTIDKINANQFEFDKVKFRFSIEDGKSVNIENIRFNWCNGIVSTESFRLPAQDNLLSLILYCDRLELSSLLKQVGAFHAQGEGALSGRIPIVYSNGKISFDKGFLFSTPGKGGRVVIKNTEKLIAGIPLGTKEFVQLDLAREVLKDFDYKWAKLELNTFEDTLFMNLELDGKPAGILPFEYKKEINSFVRVDASSPGSHFQGIKMDVNLKLPFNQVLKFGNKIKNVLN